MNKSYKVLICPQHWGLGHVTRTIPVIQHFISEGYEVFLASSGAANEILRKEFPDLKLFELADYRILYPFKSMYLNLGYQLLKMHFAIIQEHFQIRKLVKTHKFDLIISDARLGAAQRGLPSVIISHHLHFPLGNKLFEWISGQWVKFFYVQFDQLWIPDFPGTNNLSGDLAHNYKSNKAFFIGALSRFKFLNIPKKYDIAIVLSGPEPQRTYLETKLLEQIQQIPAQKIIFIRGTSSGPSFNAPLLANLEIKNLVHSKELNEIMCSSELIICRSGYSTLLDLSVIKKKALLIPTPGQPEQIYLAKILEERKMFYQVSQDSLDLKQDIDPARKFQGYTENYEESSLSEILKSLTSKLLS